jgi:hypothetical protein
MTASALFEHLNQDRRRFNVVMPGLDPGIHASLFGCETWMAGTSPAMTDE